MRSRLVDRERARATRRSGRMSRRGSGAGEGQALECLGFGEVRAGAACYGFFRVDGESPGRCRPECLGVIGSPGPCAGPDVGGQELFALLDGGWLPDVPGGREDGGRDPGYYCLWLADNTVPVVHDQEPATRPPHVVRVPVGMTDHPRRPVPPQSSTAAGGGGVEPA